MRRTVIGLLAARAVISSGDTAQEPAQTMNAPTMNAAWMTHAAGQIYEYATHANPPMPEIPVRIFGPELHEAPGSRVIPLDLSAELELAYPATSPNLLASFVRVDARDRLATSVGAATSQAFYVIRGRGRSRTRAGDVEWKRGDLFVLPYFGDEAAAVCADGDARQCVEHACDAEPLHGGCALYWVHDGPLLSYIGAKPTPDRFPPSFFDGEVVRGVVEGVGGVDEATGLAKNRRGVLLGNRATQAREKTLTPSLWSLLNVITGGQDQQAHRHNSVALDFAVDDGAGDALAPGEPADGLVYTAMGRELDADGNIVDAIRVPWRSGGVFVTPPGWWHSHHNLRANGTAAWVLPIQDAGLYTHQRTLDIRFAGDEIARLRRGRHRGATLDEQPEPARREPARREPARREPAGLAAASENASSVDVSSNFDAPREVDTPLPLPTCMGAICLSGSH